MRGGGCGYGGGGAFPKGPVTQEWSLGIGERASSEGGVAHVPIGLEEDFVLDVKGLKFLAGPSEGFQMGDSQDDEAGDAVFWVVVCSCGFCGGVCGLNELLVKGDVCADKDVNGMFVVGHLMLFLSLKTQRGVGLCQRNQGGPRVGLVRRCS